MQRGRWNARVRGRQKDYDANEVEVPKADTELKSSAGTLQVKKLQCSS